MLRKIVEIDQDKCNGCGLCVPSCAEGAISIVNGKAVLAADNLCDGLGACLGDCPLGAIRITEREADAFDEAAVEEHLKQSGQSHQPRHEEAPAADAPPIPSPAAPRPHGGGCPGSRAMSLDRPAAGSVADQPSTLGQWPVQLHLVPVNAPYFQGADLLIAADCAPFAYGAFHRDFLAGKAVVVGCPKLDDNQAYLEKLTEIFRRNDLHSITVVRMEVPCCGGIVMAARQALNNSGKAIPLKEVTVTIDGKIRE
jgi:NAD-dependent dihydropyrimidine dehydrogenase PreA subunit